jgi:hypothetical protein
VDNSIKLKELQVTGALKNGDEGLGIVVFFSKRVFFWVRRGGWGNATPFQRRFFFKKLGKVIYFWDGE